MLHMLVFKSSVIHVRQVPLLTGNSDVVFPHAVAPLRVAIADPFHPERENLLEIYFDAPIIGNCSHGELYGFDHAAI